jgi:hypothetical protein
MRLALNLPAGKARGEGDHPKGGGGVAAVDSEDAVLDGDILCNLPLHHASHGPPPRRSATGTLGE